MLMNTSTKSIVVRTMEMDLKIKTDCSNIDWQAVAEMLKKVGMTHHAPEDHKKAFEASHTTVFIGNSDLVC